MARKGHVPQRTCLGCGRKVAKDGLVRFTLREQDGDLVLIVDEIGSEPGRGAYVCPSEECYDRALDRKAFTRKLGAASGHPGLKEEFMRMLETRR